MNSVHVSFIVKALFCVAREGNLAALTTYALCFQYSGILFSCSYFYWKVLQLAVIVSKLV